MLVRTADAMRQVTREGDLVARLGGDEFVVVLPNAAPDHAADIARRIRTEVTRAAEAMNAEVSASIGVTFREPDESWPDAVDRADRAMLNAKRITYGRIQVFETEAVQEVGVTGPDEEDITYVFILRRQTDSLFQGCWMTEAVFVKPNAAIGSNSSGSSIVAFS